MAPDELDLAGFAVGVVEDGTQLGPERVRAGDAVVGLASPGLRSNGYTLARHVLLERAGLDLDDPAWDGGRTLRGRRAAAALGDLHPGRARRARVPLGEALHACAHITGGGIVGNLPRALPDGLGAVLDRSTWDEPRVFAEIARLGPVAEDEMDRVFNRGVGMALVVDAGAVGAALARARSGGAGRRASSARSSTAAPACASRERRRPSPSCGPTCWRTRSRRATSRSSRAARAAGSSTPSRRCAGPRPCCSWPTPCSRWSRPRRRPSAGSPWAPTPSPS